MSDHPDVEELRPLLDDDQRKRLTALEQKARAVADGVAHLELLTQRLDSLHYSDDAHVREAIEMHDKAGRGVHWGEQFERDMDHPLRFWVPYLLGVKPIRFFDCPISTWAMGQVAGHLDREATKFLEAAAYHHGILSAGLPLTAHLIGVLGQLVKEKPATPPQSEAPNTQTDPTAIESEDADDAATPAKHPDGPEGGRWLWWSGERFDVPVGSIFRLIAWFWSHQSESYDSLSETGIEVFDSAVQSDTVAKRVNEANHVLCHIGVTWHLKPNLKARCIARIDGVYEPKRSRKTDKARQ